MNQLLKRGIPEDLLSKNLCGEGHSKKVFYTNIGGLLIAYFKPSYEGDYFKVLRAIREGIDLNDAKYPSQIPACDLKSKEVFVVIENWGDTLDKKNLKKSLVLQNISDQQIISFVLNLVNLSSVENGIITDCKLANMTFDEQNGLAIIDIALRTKKKWYFNFENLRNSWEYSPISAIKYIQQTNKRRTVWQKYNQMKLVDMFFKPDKLEIKPLRERWLSICSQSIKISEIMNKTLKDINDEDLALLKTLLTELL